MSMMSFNGGRGEIDTLVAGMSSCILSVKSGAFSLEAFFRSLACIAEHDPGLIRAEWVAGAAWILTQSEVREGGPYRSRIGDQGDPDLETNVQIRRFLRTQDIVLDPLNEWLAKQGDSILQEEKKYDHQNDSLKKTDKAHVEYQHDSYIVPLVQRRLALVGESLRLDVEDELKAMFGRDQRGEKTRLPLFFFEGIDPSIISVSPEVVRMLCIAHTYGWMAYTVLDRYLDEDHGAHTLSTVPFCLREMMGIYQALGPSVATYARNTLDRCDVANAHELQCCRLIHALGGSYELPEFLPSAFYQETSLADRSLGHLIGSVSILLRSGVATDHAYVRATESFFTRVICAKQLCDDIEDWWEDLRRGHLNAVGCEVIRAWQSLTHRPDLSIERDESSLRSVMLESVLEEVIRAVRTHADQASAALRQMTFLSDTTFCMAMINVYQKTADRLEYQLKERRAFLQEFGSNAVDDLGSVADGNFPLRPSTVDC